MRVSFRACIFPEDISMARRLGFPSIELLWDGYKRMQMENYVQTHKTEIRKLLEEANIQVPAVLSLEEYGFDKMKESIDYFVTLGAKVYVVHPRKIAAGDKPAIRAFKDRYAKAVEYGLSKGVRLAVKSWLQDPDSWDAMFEAIPEIGFKYDPSFSVKADRNWRQEMRKYGKRIVHAHAKDEMFIGYETAEDGQRTKKMMYAPAGMGDFNWGSFMSLLYEIDYKGDIAIEPHGGVWVNKHRELGLILAKRHLEQFIR